VEKALPSEIDPSQVTITRFDDYFHVQFKAELFESAMVKRVLENLSQKRMPGLRRILCEDCAHHWNLTTGGIISLIESLRYDDIFDWRIAWVSGKASHLDDLRFAENAGVNRGYDMKAFSETPMALSWLLQN